MKYISTILAGAMMLGCATYPTPDKPLKHYSSQDTPAAEVYRLIHEQDPDSFIAMQCINLDDKREVTINAWPRRPILAISLHDATQNPPKNEYYMDRGLDKQIELYMESTGHTRIAGVFMLKYSALASPSSAADQINETTKYNDLCLEILQKLQ